ncbi:MAG: nucleoside diphosphate kinase regulator [Actinomycetota bacterium]
MKNLSLIVSDADFARLMAMPPTPDLQDELDKATVVPGESIGRNVVTMGAQVSYRDLKTNQLRKIEIVFPEEADPAQGKISVIAPVGAALIGLSVGQEIQWHFPDGSVHRLVVEGVTQPPATAT